MKTVAVMAVVFALTQIAFAQRLQFVVEPDASEVRMTLKTTHEVVIGTFHVESGSVDFGLGAPEMSGSIVVAAGSGKTGNDSRDKKMDKDILRVGQFTTVSFAPRTYTGRLAPSGDSTLQVSGALTLLGTGHEVTIPIQVHMDGAKTTAKAHFVIPYVAWGLKNPSFLIWKAENDVAIDLNLAGKVTK